ncbi:MAG: hypothetical protein QG641_2715, partial [Candidatus Poribacteria bacterium]|nr:hypothetical protein [Candidatus Poribacteria bacterium]
MIVKELVNLGPIMQMVRVVDYDPTFIIQSSVFARDLKTQLSIVLNRAVNRQEKNCFMVIGNYGSGKSHFLAFLGALLKNPDKWKLFTEQLLLQQEPDEQKLNSELIQSGKKLSDKRFFVVEYALDVVNLPLADIFYDRIKRSLSENGIEIKFEQSEYDHKDRMEKILSSISKINNGEKVTLVVIFDEMADWLASKIGVPLRADLSFLRSIGELSKTHDFMFFTSLQEDMLTVEHEHIEAFGNEVMRILERFEKITIVAQNVKKVASHRLLKKNKDQISRLQKLYSSLKKKLPLFNVDETEFCELYPMHPLIFDVFERMLRYLSGRSVLVYIHDAVEKILGQPVDTLVTVDQLFLVHRDSLRSVPKCAPYVVIYDNLTGDVLPRVDNDLRDMAQRALDAIILLSIIDRNLTVTELANAILKAEFDGKMNYDALASALKELAGKSGQYFDITGSGIDAVYKIVQSEGPDVESLIRTKSATLDDNDHRI